MEVSESSDLALVKWKAALRKLGEKEDAAFNKWINDRYSEAVAKCEMHLNEDAVCLVNLARGLGLQFLMNT